MIVKKNINSRRLVVLLIILCLSVLGACSKSSSQEDPIVSSRDECVDVPQCTSVTATNLTPIDKNGVHSLHLVCPDEAPYIHNLDVDQDRNVIVEVFGLADDAVSVFFRKHDPDQPGRYQAFLGCSSIPFTKGERFNGRSFAPVNIADEASPAPDASYTPPNACDNSIPACLNVTSALHKIGHLKTHKSDVICPNSHPWYALAWVSFRSSKAISITEDPFAITRFRGDGDAFLVTNWSAFHDHHWQIAIACSSDCAFSDKGCPNLPCKTGCRNDPGCKTIVPRKTECAGHTGNCWSTWEELCPDNEKWFCDTAQFWTCCETCN